VIYGVREQQLRRLLEEARRRQDATTGEVLLELLERRLDNVVYRLGLAGTRRQARQFVSHGHVEVDGRRATIPSMQVRDGRRIRIRSDAGVAEAPAPRPKPSGAFRPGSRATRTASPGGSSVAPPATRSTCRSLSSS
jgi:ribosomal protein S4